MKERHQVVPAAFVVIRDGQKVLLQRRFNTGFRDGSYEVVAGHVEAGETALDAAARELAEETGLKIHPGDLELFHIVSNDFETHNAPYLYLFFRTDIRKCEGEFTVMEPTKCDDMGFVLINSLPELVPYVAVALEHIDDAGVGFSKL